MGRTVIVVYRPKKGKDERLLQLVKDHVLVNVKEFQGLFSEFETID